MSLFDSFRRAIRSLPFVPNELPTSRRLRRFPAVYLTGYRVFRDALYRQFDYIRIQSGSEVKFYLVYRGDLKGFPLPEKGRKYWFVIPDANVAAAITSQIPSLIVNGDLKSSIRIGSYTLRAISPPSWADNLSL